MSKHAKTKTKAAKSKNPIKTHRSDAMHDPDDVEDEMEQEHEEDQELGHGHHESARDRERREQREKHEQHIANRDQDPNHPANRTLSPEREPTQRPRAEGFGVPPEELLTEQEKAAAANGDDMGVGPLSKSENTPGPVTTMEDHGIGPRTPYPTGNPPPPAESTSYSQGIKGVTDKPSAKPGASSGPVGEGPGLGDRDAAYAANRDNLAKPVVPPDRSKSP